MIDGQQDEDEVQEKIASLIESDQVVAQMSPMVTRKLLSHSELQNVTNKLSPLSTYFSLLKGFIAIGILYMPKNCKNGGWAFSLGTMVFSFFVTYYAILKMLQAREKVPIGCSFAEIAEYAVGRKGKYLVDIFLTIM